MTIIHDDTEFEPPHNSSPTDQVLTELRLYGYRPSDDEPDQRPLPESEAVTGAIVDIFDALVATLGDTRLEGDLDDLLWSTVNVFHRAVERTERVLDANEQAQRRSQQEQDGSEVKSLQLERLIDKGRSLIERRDCMEAFRDEAAGHFETQTGKPWHPRAGSRVNHRTMTAAMVDSRDYINARRRADAELLVPAGTKIAFSGGLDYNDHKLIWERLDRVREKHPDMVLLYTAAPKGADLIAAKWAANCHVKLIPFRPNWAKYGNHRAGFVRNDELLAEMPIGVLVFPGTGVQANLADKARKLGIPVWNYGDRRASAPAKDGA